MKIFTKTVLTILAFTMLAQPSNAVAMQKVKDFLSSSTTKIMQSIYNNKEAYIFGAIAVSAAIGLGWWYYTSNTIEKQLVNEFDGILNKLTKNKIDSALLKELQSVKKALLEKPADFKKALITLEDIQINNKELTFSTWLGDIAVDEKLFSSYFEEFIKKLKSQMHIDGTPYGLVNTNNSCFMNAAIQGLYSLDKCNTVLLNSKCYKPNSLAERYVQLLATIQKESGAVVDPVSFCQHVRKTLFRNEGESSQQDSTEFVQGLLDALIKEDVSQSLSRVINKDLKNLLKITISENKYDSTHTLRERKELTDPIILPPIIISDTCEITLSDCLRSYFIPEPFKPEEYPTETWKLHRILENVSRYFIILLSRVEFNNETEQQSKIEQKISFELENFNIDALSLGTKKFPLYRCKAFIVHSGSPWSGHYTAYVRNNNDWYLCDDATITPVSLEFIRNFAEQGALGGKTPVMFFYEQQLEAPIKLQSAVNPIAQEVD